MTHEQDVFELGERVADAFAEQGSRGGVEMWTKSTSCGDAGCIEVRAVERGGEVCFQIRDSSKPDGPVLTFTESEWDAFIKGVQAGEFRDFEEK